MLQESDFGFDPYFRGEILDGPTDYFRLFPSDFDVFAKDSAEHARHFVPIATVDLRRLNPDWDERVHFVIPCSEYRDEVSPFDTYLTRENWFGFRVIDSKYEFDTNFALFDGMKPEVDSTQVAAEVQESRRFFEANGALVSFFSRPDDSEEAPEKEPILWGLFGVSWDGNWSNGTTFPLSRYPDTYTDRRRTIQSERVLPRTPDGRDFIFIGDIETSLFASVDGHALLFYDPVDKIALTTIDYS